MASSTLDRLVRRHRRILAAGCVGLAIVALGVALRPPQAATRVVVVAARDLPAGQRLDDAELTLAEVPAGLAVPGAASDPDTLVGRVTATALARGEAVAATRLLTPPAWALPPGSVPLPVRFPDAAAVGLLAPGERVDVLAASGPAEDGAGAWAPARVVARAALVLAVAGAGAAGADGSARGSGDSDWFGGDTASGPAPLVVLAVPQPEALAVTAAAARERLGFTLAPAAGG